MQKPIPYGNAPKDLGLIELEPSEMMCYLYLPIKMAGDPKYRIPERLEYLQPLLGVMYHDLLANYGKGYMNNYVYLTAKTLYVEGTFSGNRPGWHADGYGSDGDLNYIWYDMNPTEFAVQDFVDIPDDDVKSMQEMERQVDPEKIANYPLRHLLRLDESVVHRVSPNIQAGMRTFIKLSVSKHQYNLKGNSHNYLFDYSWDLADRATQRNMDNNKDFAK
jgi:hypothetical protein